MNAIQHSLFINDIVVKLYSTIKDVETIAASVFVILAIIVSYKYLKTSL